MTTPVTARVLPDRAVKQQQGYAQASRPRSHRRTYSASSAVRRAFPQVRGSRSTGASPQQFAGGSPPSTAVPRSSRACRPSSPDTSSPTQQDRSRRWLASSCRSPAGSYLPPVVATANQKSPQESAAS